MPKQQELAFVKFLMATLDTSTSPLPSPSMIPRRWSRKCERYCCLSLTYFPLAFVYGLTTWAVWVEAAIGFESSRSRCIGTGTSFIGIVLYLLLNWSYTTAVFTNPGSTIETNDGYNSLPTHVPRVTTSFTVKSTGEMRYCKKCQARKPDRAHHCSSCGRCVLKMDHHCPWLAACVGFRNYKAFLLFLIYTTVFCFVCLLVSGAWVWAEVLSDEQYTETLMPINYVMLTVISGVSGLVLFAFTGWHIVLASRNQTTIECLEKTRYLSPLRASMRQQHNVDHQENGSLSYGQQLKDAHTNALPGVTRPEEGHVVIGQPRTYQSYDALERSRARAKYQEYLEEEDSAKLPNAFDLGWRRNLRSIFGENPLLWALPVYTTLGDGWAWDPSPKWLAVRDIIRSEREAQQQLERAAGWGGDPSWEEQPYTTSSVRDFGAARHYLSSPAPQTGDRKSPSKADRILGRDVSQYADDPASFESATPLQTLKPQIELSDEDDYDTSSDEVSAQRRDVDRRLGRGWSASGLLGKPTKAKGFITKNHWGDPVDDDDGVD